MWLFALSEKKSFADVPRNINIKTGRTNTVHGYVLDPNTNYLY